MMTLIWVLIFLLLPVAVLWACSKYAILDAIGGVVICYVIGIVIGNVNILPTNSAVIQDYMTTLTVPIALPLIFFSMHIANWKDQSSLVIRSFVGALIAVLIGSFISFLIFGDRIGPDAWKVAGMLVGCYTGGTPNMAALGTALEVDTSTYIAVHASDVLVCGLLFLIMISVLPKVLRKILPIQKASIEEGMFKKPEEDAVFGQKEFTPYFSGFNRQDLPPLIRALLFSIIIFAIGGGLSFIVPEWIAPVVAIIVITTLGVIGSFSKHMRESAFTFQLGYYFLLVFSLVVSSMANISQMTKTAPVFMGYIATLITITFIIHVVLSKIMKVDGDTQLITATSLIFSPPFVPVVAASLKNRSVIMTGMVTGIAGWVIGNYIGVAFGYLMKML